MVKRAPLMPLMNVRGAQTSTRYRLHLLVLHFVFFVNSGARRRPYKPPAGVTILSSDERKVVVLFSVFFGVIKPNLMFPEAGVTQKDPWSQEKVLQWIRCILKSCFCE